MAGEEAFRRPWREPCMVKSSVHVIRQSWMQAIIPLEFVENLSLKNVIRRERVLQGPPLDERADEGGLTGQ